MQTLLGRLFLHTTARDCLDLLQAGAATCGFVAEAGGKTGAPGTPRASAGCGRSES
jgi:hypothetical protein